MSDRLDTSVRLLEALEWSAERRRPRRSEWPPETRSWFREGIGRMVVPSCINRLILNGRVNQPHATAAPRVVLPRMLGGRAATVRVFLHRGATPGFGAAPPTMPGSAPTTGDMHAA